MRILIYIFKSEWNIDFVSSICNEHKFKGWFSICCVFLPYDNIHVFDEGVYQLFSPVVQWK